MAASATFTVLNLQATIVSPDVDRNYGGVYPQITILPNGEQLLHPSVRALHADHFDAV